MPKLAVGTTIAEAYRFVWSRRKDVAARGAPAIFLLTALILSVLYGGPGNPWFLPLLLITYIPAIALLMSFVVSWHRLVLFGEEEAGVPIHVRFGGRELKCFGLFLLFNLLVIFSLLAILPVVWAVFWAALQFRPTDPATGVAAIASALVVSICLAPRFLLAFPAVAADGKAALKEAWALSAGNATRILLASFGVAIPFSLAFLLVVGALAAAELRLAYSLFSAVFYVVGTALAATLLSLAYLALRRPPQAGAPGLPVDEVGRRPTPDTAEGERREGGSLRRG